MPPVLSTLHMPDAILASPALSILVPIIAGTAIGGITQRMGNSTTPPPPSQSFLRFPNPLQPKEPTTPSANPPWLPPPGPSAPFGPSSTV